MDEHRIAVIGAGSMARCHGLALLSLPHYYESPPRLVCLAVVASSSPERRAAFAERFGFDEALDPETLWSRDDVNAVIIASPNHLHFAHLDRALQMSSVHRVYLEKPPCTTLDEEEEIARRVAPELAGKTVQVGFQFLQMGAVRRALRRVRQGDFGQPIHFSVRYLHGGYLKPEYRSQRRSRLRPAPEGGAVADLGSHALSLLVAFLGADLEVIAAQSTGEFSDVPPASDLCTVALLRDTRSGAVGTLTVSRISAGAGDLLDFELRASDGALRLSTERPDLLEVFDPRTDSWSAFTCGNDFSPLSTFPVRQVSAGWLRSLVHAQHLFLGGDDPDAFLPDLRHGLVVQGLIRQIVEKAGSPTADKRPEK
jgi:predicted dehydrogenase